MIKIILQSLSHSVLARFFTRGEKNHVGPLTLHARSSALTWKTELFHFLLYLSV